MSMTMPPTAAVPDPPVPPEPPVQPVSRAGRDLKAAIGVGVVLGIVIITTLLVRKESFLVVMAVAVAIGMWELQRALRNVAVRAPLVPAVAGMVGMTWAAYVHGPAGLVTAWVLTCAVIVLWRGSGRLDGAGRDVLGGIFISTYPPLLVGFAVLLLAAPDGVGRMFVFLITAVCSDIGGYAAGVWLRQAPDGADDQPEEVLGGLRRIRGPVHHRRLPDRPLLPRPPVVDRHPARCHRRHSPRRSGDLMESLIKRDLGIKDMSNVLPGHGGIMDRLDSLIVVVPIVWAVLSLLAEQAA